MEKIKCKLEPGEAFDFKGINWTILDPNCEGGVLVIASKIWKEDTPFDKNGCNNYAKSSVRELLHGLESEIGAENLVLHWTDLTADNGSKEYGEVNDGVFLLTCDDYRKYRDYMPHYDDWIWTCTPWPTPGTGLANYVRGVNTDGTLSSHGAGNIYGVAPACILHLSIYESPASQDVGGVCQKHPLDGETRDNKIAYCLARAQSTMECFSRDTAIVKLAVVGAAHCLELDGMTRPEDASVINDLANMVLQESEALKNYIQTAYALLSGEDVDV